MRQKDVRTQLDKSKQAVSSGEGLLKLTMRDGSVGYPVVQFEGGVVLPGLREVVHMLAGVVATPWTTASWLTSPLEGAATPVELLRDGQVEEVTLAARRVVRAWAH